MKRVIVAAVPILAATLLALPWYLGVQAEAAYRNALTELSAQGMRLVENRYERGWFRSTALAELEGRSATAGAQGGESLRLRIASRLMHGPWYLDAPRPMPAAAIVESRVETMVPDMDLPPMLVTARVELDGSGLASLRVPAVEWPAGFGNPGLRMPESRGEMRFGAGLGSVAGEYELPSFELATETGTVVSVHGLRSESSGSRGVGGLFLGRGSVEIEHIRVRGPDGETSISGLSAELESVPRGALIDFRIDYGADRLTVAGRSYDSARLVLAVSGLPAEGLAQLRRATADTRIAPMSETQQQPSTGLLLARFLPLLLARDPRIALERLEVTTPDGKIEANLSLGIRGMTRDVIESPGAWLFHLEGEGELHIPRSALLKLLTQWYGDRALDELRKRDPALSQIPEGLELDIADAASNQLDTLLRDGWAIERSGQVHTNLHLANAMLTINGKTFPLAGFAK